MKMETRTKKRWPHGRHWRKASALWLGAALLVPLLAACGFGQGAEPEEERVLRIATVESYGNQFDSIRTEYTDLFDFTHPQIELEFVSAVDNSRYNWSRGNEEIDPVAEMKALMQSDNPPDVVMLDYRHLPEFVEENLLTSLDPLISEHGMDLSDFAPAVIDGLKAVGNDQLYALAPTFSSSALVYNRSLFTEAGVNLPTDGMTWPEVFDLAKLISGGEGDDQVFGFSFQRYYYFDPFQALQLYATPLGLSFMDDAGENLTVDNAVWADVWTTIIDLQESGIFPEEPERSAPSSGIWNPYDHDAFLSGKLAMTIMSYRELDEIINLNNSVGQMEGYEYIDWDVVTMPVHPAAPEVGGQMYMDPVFAINARAGNRDDAWALIEFIHSEDWAQLKSRSSYNLLARMSHVEPKQGIDFNVEAFYQLKPAPEWGMQELYQINPEFFQVEHIGRMKFQQVMQGDKSVEEALAEWQTEGNAMLQQIREQTDADPSGNGFEVAPPSVN